MFVFLIFYQNLPRKQLFSADIIGFSHLLTPFLQLLSQHAFMVKNNQIKINKLNKLN